MSGIYVSKYDEYQLYIRLPLGMRPGGWDCLALNLEPGRAKVEYMNYPNLETSEQVEPVQ